MNTLTIDPRLVPAQLNLLLGRPPARGWRVRAFFQRLRYRLGVWKRPFAERSR